MNYSNSTLVINYYKYHQNPINKMIHLMCIPMIMISILTFLKKFKIKSNSDYITYVLKLNFRDLITLYYIAYYYSWSLKIGFFMQGFIAIINYIVDDLKLKPIPNFKLFAFAWTMQFFGHYVEGNRPALIDSLSQAFLQAPLFTVATIFPSILN
tara:strand:+ start:1308 stop:1769 length:462 start_codon:yes stop_codon:yes gene_type:complete